MTTSTPQTPVLVEEINRLSEERDNAMAERDALQANNESNLQSHARLVDKYNELLMERDHLKARVAQMREAIALKINGMSVLDYLEQQHPGTKGHIPLRFYFEKLYTSLSTPAPVMVPFEEHYALKIKLALVRAIFSRIESWAANDMPVRLWRERVIALWREARVAFEGESPAVVPADKARVIAGHVKAAYKELDSTVWTEPGERARQNAILLPLRKALTIARELGLLDQPKTTTQLTPVTPSALTNPQSTEGD